MPPLSFDLKKFLAQAAYMDAEELADTIMQGRDTGAGLEEYMNETHRAGWKVLNSYVTQKELSHLLAMVAGSSVQEVLEMDGLSEKTRAFVGKAMMSNPDAVRALTLSILCAAVGIVCKEEWR